MPDHNLFIQDIVVVGGRGEYEENPPPPYSIDQDNIDLLRLLAHVKDLVKYAHRAHQLKVRLYSGELLTRVTLNEFSLYRKHRPYTIEQYRQFIEEVNNLTKNLPPNIHIILATLPVIWTDNKMHNVGLYVQSPNKPGSDSIIHHFYKRVPAITDFKYRDHKGDVIPLFNLLDETKHLDDTLFSPQWVLAKTRARYNNFDQYGSTIRLKTQRGIYFITSVEICLDHSYRLALLDAKELVNKFINFAIPIPKLGTHVLISNHIERDKAQIIGEGIHADPYNHTLNTAKEIEGYELNKPEFGKKVHLLHFEIYPMGRVIYENMDYLSGQAPAKHIADSIQQGLAASKNATVAALNIQTAAETIKVGVANNGLFKPKPQCPEPTPKLYKLFRREY